MHAKLSHKLYPSALRFIGLVLLLSLVLSACSEQATPAPTVDIGAVQTQAAQTVVADLTQNAPPPPTIAPEPTEAATPPGGTPNPDVPNAVLPTPEAGQPSAVADFNTFIYSGPGQNYVVYGALVGGRSALVTGRNQEGTWWAVSVPPAPDGNGWVSAEWVTVRDAGSVPVLPAPPVPATTALVPAGPADPQVLTLVNTFVRSGPANNYPAYGVAEAGTTGRVIGVSSDGEWWVVRIDPKLVGAGYGWVGADYVQATNVEDVLVISSPAQVSAASLPAPAPDAATATTVDYVNVRSGPGTNYLVYGVAPPGATAEVSGLSTDGQWWQVVVPTATVASDGVAWISASFVYTQNTTGVPVVESPPTPTVISPENPPTVGNCSLLSQVPTDRSQFAPNTPFVTTWVLQNTGDDPWEQTDYDIRFMGAYDNVVLHAGAEVYDLPTTINSGWNLPISIQMVAPGQPGTYAEGWSISLGNQVVCPFFVIIEVK